MYIRYFMRFLLASGIFIPASIHAENPVQKMAKNFTPPPSIIKSPRPANITPKIVPPTPAKTPAVFSPPAFPTKALSSARNSNTPLIKNNINGHTPTPKGTAAGGLRKKPSPPAINNTPLPAKKTNQAVVKTSPPPVAPRTNVNKQQLSHAGKNTRPENMTRNIEKKKAENKVFVARKQGDIQLNNTKKVNNKKFSERKQVKEKTLNEKILTNKMLANKIKQSQFATNRKPV